MPTRVITQQHPTIGPLPQAEAWSSGLCHCFQDMRICCLYFWCYICMTCHTAKKFGECVCLPLLDILGTFLTTVIYFPICVPPIALAMRVAVRRKYGIPGTIGDDCPKATFCGPCSWCQIHREMKLRNKPITIISHQPQPVFQNAAHPPNANMPPPHYSAGPPPYPAGNPSVVIVR